MALVIDVPLTTTLADVDEVLRKLLKQELGRHGFEGVEIAFDAPSRDWSGKLTGPTVNLFLYDIREVPGEAKVSFTETRSNGGAMMTPPPLRLEVTYAITAWTKAIEDEHRLLSQLLSVLHSYRTFPEGMLPASVGPIDSVVGRPMEEKADFWTAVGGQYKPAIDYALRLTLESGASFTRGPEVRTQVLQTRLSDAPRRAVAEMHRFGGKLRDKDDQPIADAWVTLPELGAWASTDRDGRFIFDRVRPGSYKLVARSMDGGELEATVEVPGTTEDLVMGAPAKKSGGSRKAGA